MQYHELAKRLKEQFGSMVIEVADKSLFPHVIIEKDSLLDICRYCLTDEAFSLDFLECVTGLDDSHDLAVIYHLFSTKYQHRLNLKLTTGRHQPELPSMTTVWAAALYYEAEIKDMFGISFVGNSRAGRLLLPEDWLGNPLRKDYEYPEAYQDVEHRRAPVRKEHMRP